MLTTRWRDNETGAVVDAIRNPGTWAPVLAWLDATGYTVPFLGVPAVIRNPADGTLKVITPDGEQTAGTGDFVILGRDNQFTVSAAAEFEARHTPEPWITTPDPWTEEQNAKFQREWDEFMNSDLARQHRITVLPAGTLRGPVTHIAGHQAQVGTRLRQRCSWCGTILIDYDLSNLAVPEGQDPAPPMWETGGLVRVDGIMSQLLDHGDGSELPEDACARTPGTP